MKNPLKDSLLTRIANFENLYQAFKECSRGKRSTSGYQTMLPDYAEQLKQIEDEILSTRTYRWGGYRKFFVHDPKKRVVMSAPFRDRVVHTAIHRVIDPMIDPLLSSSTYACRKGKGNRSAVVDLFHALNRIGEKYYAIKLDVEKYFYSIDHGILQEQLQRALPDDSLMSLISNLLDSCPEFAFDRRGIPIGNLTSQLFANFYLATADQEAMAALANRCSIQSYYTRYMDDMVFVSQDKNCVLDAAEAVIFHCENHLRLRIPYYKRVHLGAGNPIAFLGYLVSIGQYEILARNQRRFKKKIRRLEKRGAAQSLMEQVKLSYQAWCYLDLGVRP